MLERFTYKGSQLPSVSYEMLAESAPSLDKSERIDKRPGGDLFGEGVIESILHYYGIENNYEELLKYIKSRVAHDYEADSS